MASIGKLQTTKDGRRYWPIQVSMGKGQSNRKTRYYWPESYSEKAAIRARDNYAFDFEQKCKSGQVPSRKEIAEQEAARQAELAALKTVKQYAENIFMPTKLQSISENTRLSYTSNLNKHILPVLGNYLMVDVTSAMITKLLLDFRASHSYGSTIKVYNILNGIFDMALFDDTIRFSPMNKVRRPKQKKDEKAIAEADKAYNAEELNYVLDSVAQEPIKWQAFLYLAADTGCRRGELVGLQWDDIDWKEKTVSIKHNLQYSKAKKLGEAGVICDGIYDVTPKGGKFRKIDLGDDTIELLKKYKADLTKPDDSRSEDVVDINEYRKQQSENKKKTLPKWVFTVDGTEDPMHPTSPTHYFRVFGERYQIPGFHPHLLRHTFASLSLTNGGDVKSIADRLGHADAAVTLRMYAHANDESIRRAGQAARDALARQKEEQKRKKESTEA